MKKIVTALVVLFIVLAGGFFAFVYSGVYNIAASEAHFPPVRWLLETTMRNSVEAHAKDIQMPQDYKSLPVENGLKPYIDMCEMCHGAPGVKPTEVGKGLLPEPPELSKAVKEWKTGELFWIVKHGVKMTGMPAFGRTHRDEEIWPVISFIEQKLPSLFPKEYQALKKEAKATESSGHGHDH